jgi:lipocalin
MSSEGFLEVDNYSNNGMVNGPVQNSDDNESFSNLCGKQIDGGKLSVAPCAFRGSLWDTVAGPYWVLAVGKDYSWAIVSGGQPNQPYPSTSNPSTTLCTTKEGSSFLDTNGSGLWLFTREKIADATTIKEMEGTLLAMGVYTGNLKDVTQVDCQYNGATLKEEIPAV